MATRKNPQDATIRNVRASRKHEAELREKYDALADRVSAIEQAICDSPTDTGCFKHLVWAIRKRFQ